MAKVVDRIHAQTGRPAFICDYSPPRSGRPDDVPAPPQSADFISAAYNPGRAVRMNPVATAAVLRERHGADPIFTLATRDMNRLALESLLLGAQALGLENVIVVAGDAFGPRDTAAAVYDYRPTELIAAITNLNSGADHRGSNLRSPSDFCIGATVDLGRGVESEALLAVRKVAAGADFLITQPVFDPAEIGRFTDACARAHGEALSVPVFYGVGLMDADGVSFAAVPQWVTDDLAAGRSGVDVALQIWEELRGAGATDCYLVPPIRRSGARDYDAAGRFLEGAGPTAPV
ncbi:MAG: methylenetetrahydrofolate reductase [Chloroflexota bacterium]|nr:methylenetetrahydrofolate reductase [Chloroflexota bacterium]MDE2958568.1 methylenetetrahydrofolate reductase [Chloroflexota bacterium]